MTAKLPVKNWGLPLSKRLLTTVARVTAHKGHDTVLRALAKLPSSIREHLQYVIAGRGPATKALQQLASELGVADAVHWLGFVDETQLVDLYRASDLFVLCSRENRAAQAVEGFGLVFLEAQACGTPVVGTRSGGIPSAVEHGVGGWLIDEDDAAALADWLKTLATRPELIEKEGLHARQRVEQHFTWLHYRSRLANTLQARGVHLGV